jgi:hypothetical protein
MTQDTGFGASVKKRMKLAILIIRSKIRNKGLTNLLSGNLKEISRSEKNGHFRKNNIKINIKNSV